MEDLGRLSRQNLTNAINKLRLHFKTFVTSIQPRTSLEMNLSWEDACQQIYVKPYARNFFNNHETVSLEERMQAFLQSQERLAVIMGDPSKMIFPN